MALRDTAETQIAVATAVNNEDQGLIDRFLAGDETAFSELVTRYRKQVYAVAYRFTNNGQEADDLAQETFIRAYRSLERFRGEASFRTWLLRITTNLSINMKKSGRISKDSGDTPDENLAEDEGSALSGMIDDERKQALRRAIEKLPPKQKQTLLLKTYQDMTCEEVAQAMGCSTGTVKANVFNALKKLKTLLHPGVTV